jgi:hypothetical protein
MRRHLQLTLEQSETFNVPDAEVANERNITWDNSVHGFDGPVQASHARYDYPGSGRFYHQISLYLKLNPYQRIFIMELSVLVSSPHMNPTTALTVSA